MVAASMLSVVDALDVEDDGDRRDVGGELDDAGALDAAVERPCVDLLDRERAVGAGERDGAGLERLAARAGAGGVVVDGDVGVGGLEAGGPGLDGDLLRRGAGAGELAGEATARPDASAEACAAAVSFEAQPARARAAMAATAPELGDAGDLHCVNPSRVRE